MSVSIRVPSMQCSFCALRPHVHLLIREDVGVAVWKSYTQLLHNSSRIIKMTIAATPSGHKEATQTNGENRTLSDRQTGRQTGRQADRQADRQASRQAGRQTERETGGQAG